MVPHVALVKWSCKVKFFRLGCLRLFCWCFTDSGVKREAFRCQNGPEKVSNATNMEPKGCQIEPRHVPKQPLGSRVEKVRQKEGGGTIFSFRVPFLFKIHKYQIQKSSKACYWQTYILIPRGYQHGVKIDTQSHQKTIQKQVSKRIMEIIKSNVFDV